MRGPIDSLISALSATDDVRQFVGNRAKKRGGWSIIAQCQARLQAGTDLYGDPLTDAERYGISCTEYSMRVKHGDPTVAYLKRGVVAELAKMREYAKIKWGEEIILEGGLQ